MASPAPLHTVLIANRGEIAVRVARACKDAGLTSVAVYAEPDRDAPHVRIADQAFALGGETAADSYLDIEKIIAAAKESGANGIHPGYGFLSENSDFAQAVLDAGLIWIGPSPQAIRDLGDKVTARKIAERAGAPLVPGTKDPVADADEVVAFADEHGLPVAIKAAFGGGGRGMRVARERDEIKDMFDAAVREAVSAFGRGESFVERYLDRPRHVEAQVLADQHGNCIVVGTRDCSLQRRHQKLVEEAPAPFLTDEQRKRIHTSARDICVEAGYSGAGTVEFLVGEDGTISFLEVNTRLQVEHPVSEETSGLDLVREQFRIANGEELRFTEDPEPRGHSIEFRLNGEDAGRGFLPAPGTVTRFVAPAGPGVRVDAGVEDGTVIGGQFDSMVGKLIITGEDRQQALERSRRALDEIVVEGLPTVIPFHRLVVTDPAFTAPEGASSFTVHTRWIETEWDNTVEPYVASGGGEEDDDEAAARQTVVVEVGGKRLEVSLPGGLSLGGGGAAAPAAKKKSRKRTGGGAKVSGDAVTSPMQGTVVKVAVSEGDTVSTGDQIVVVEAMKMENPVTAHKDGTVTGLSIEPGASVNQGAVICEIAD
ncbi:acetyl/propionyl/methylcrotonyl-CoA carboxylase subunit alpha [Actinomycetospora sp. TBRC 11914]|uniref:acetyl/propionyl/methylcrotonyl-CoA carboxylase subunit alpha n=1 Tax=Actinomycetospora sp. TBRC 11914 TaxID=2729387 RepID=UPI00145D2EFD|nr:acetyl/propionyl/methylcrotonyl-CoA carboxylase subunit alpha [Actinomycetospora sp. TBRC 11914]NMO90817.1 acetyl/propionyl/methylcrotonyl-CoA carboxylase subunit alpha [Actinomycetospora sp. TBRC 11914]